MIEDNKLHSRRRLLVDSTSLPSGLSVRPIAAGLTDSPLSLMRRWTVSVCGSLRESPDAVLGGHWGGFTMVLPLVVFAVVSWRGRVLHPA